MVNPIMEGFQKWTGQFFMFQEEENKQRLLDAFTGLTQNTPLTAERIHRIRFRETFDKFIVNVRGFLFVK